MGIVYSELYPVNLPGKTVTLRFCEPRPWMEVVRSNLAEVPAAPGLYVLTQDREPLARSQAYYAGSTLRRTLQQRLRDYYHKNPATRGVSRHHTQNVLHLLQYKLDNSALDLGQVNVFVRWALFPESWVESKLIEQLQLASGRWGRKR